MDDLLKKALEKKQVLILGFGREGQSSFRTFRKLFPHQPIAVADRDPEVGGHQLFQDDTQVSVHTGPHYLEDIDRFDLILKSPGVSLKNLSPPVDPHKITSQTDLFLRRFASQVIGVTGTKGKSTTSSLIYHILKNSGRDVLLMGNIGIPAFHFLDQIHSGTFIVYELSSHQLEFIRQGPFIAVVLNIFQEHLDAYAGYREYQQAKMNIVTTRNPSDVLVFNADDPVVGTLVSTLKPSTSRSLFPFTFSGEVKYGCFCREEELIVRTQEEYIFPRIHNRYLRGDHNLRNMMAALSVAALLRLEGEIIEEGISTYKGLAHRMEDIGWHQGIQFYDDSIATIPEATIAAVKSLEGIDTLILGGFDRGIDYGPLAVFLAGSEISHVILNGPAGKRIGEEIQKLPKSPCLLHFINRFDDFLPIALGQTRPGKICLLSPAAASYDEFKSFEERGRRFQELVSANK